MPDTTGERYAASPGDGPLPGPPKSDKGHVVIRPKDRVHEGNGRRGATENEDFRCQQNKPQFLQTKSRVETKSRRSNAYQR